MQYTEHPEYVLYQDKIEKLMKEGFPKNPLSIENHYTVQPPTKNKKQYSIMEVENQNLIGQEKGFLKVIGFEREEIVSLRLNLLVCQCSCGSYCLVKSKTFIKAKGHLSCSQCAETYNGFSSAFGRLHGVNLDGKVVLSIFGGVNLEIDTFISSDCKVDQVYENPFKDFSMDELRELTNQYNALSIDVFPLSENRNEIKSPKSTGKVNENIINCYVAKPDLTVIEAVPQHLHNRNLSQIIGNRINRFKVVGILHNSDYEKYYTTQRAKLVLRCDCGMYSIYNYKTVRKDFNNFSCNRCKYIQMEVIRRESTDAKNIISASQAWDMLGYQPKNIQHTKVVINSDLSNSYFFERKRFNQDKVYDNHKQYFGLRFGFVVITDKSKRSDEDKGFNYAIANCDCGQECIFSYELLSDQSNRVVLACSQCAYEINHTLHDSIKIGAIGRANSIFQKKWKFYLNYFNYPNDVKFELIWQTFLILRKKNPTLSFKLVANKLIERSLKLH